MESTQKKRQYQWEYHSKFAYLNTQFGLELACKKFNKTPEEIEALVGRYTKGKRKGELRGCLQWFKVIRGGWVKTGSYDWDAMQGCGFVAKPGVCFAFMIVHFDKTILVHEDTVVIRDNVHAASSYSNTMENREKKKTGESTASVIINRD